MNLSEYVGREDELEHLNGREILKIVHCPEAKDIFSRVVVVFKDGHVEQYSFEGQAHLASDYFFKLKPKTYEVDSWVNLYPSGCHELHSTKGRALRAKAPNCIGTINIKQKGEIDED